MAGLAETAPAEPLGFTSQPLQTAGLEEAGHGAPGARKEQQNPCPESIRTAHTVKLRLYLCPRVQVFQLSLFPL